MNRLRNLTMSVDEKDLFGLKKKKKKKKKKFKN